MLAKLQDSLKKSIAAKEAFAKDQGKNIITLVEKIIATMHEGGKLLIFGNGGSAADAQHMAAEFINRFLINRAPLPAIALTTDTSVITSISNDFSYDDIFVKQIQALGKKGDLALGISTSGNSPNVVKAVETAMDMGIYTAVLTGGTGGILIDKADLCLNVPTSFTPNIQESHIWAIHLICQLVEEAIFGGDRA
ncbi:MAG: D-sedoheptulose 7-phosphate isomerase [Proteobacteria bacterium]|nr:D-sedoheptulose 7-phosphate isomerase [Pseudomonadota bacterium]